MFTESQQRRIDLKEDDPDMVELMIQFFYTFEYRSIPAQAEISSLGLHVRVYLIADRYEVLELKKNALERFRKGLVKHCKDGKVMIEVTRVLEESMPLPICDIKLHDLVIKAWNRGGSALFVDIGEPEVSSLFAEIEWLSVALTTRPVSILKTETLRGCYTNGNTQPHRPTPTKPKKKITAPTHEIAGEKRELTEAERLDQREKAMLYVRHRLQKGFLSRDQAPKEEEMFAMGGYLSQLETYANLEHSIMKVTKIHKVLKAIVKLDSIPREKEFGFKRRCAQLLDIWGEHVEGMDGIIKAAEPSLGQRWLASLPPAAAAKVKDVKRKA
jgi:hypothetical protein